MSDECSRAEGADQTKGFAGFGQLAHLHRAARGVGLRKVLTVHLVHLCKIVDVRQKHRGLDHIGQRHLLLCQNGLNVLEGLCSLGGDAFRDQAGGRIDGQLPGYIDGLPRTREVSGVDTHTFCENRLPVSSNVPNNTFIRFLMLMFFFFLDF